MLIDWNAVIWYDNERDINCESDRNIVYGIDSGTILQCSRQRMTNKQEINVPYYF